MQCKRLFQVTHKGKTTYFASKKEAKIYRNVLWQAGHKNAKVQLGPDHWRRKNQ